jgi:hypothetical protein
LLLNAVPAYGIAKLGWSAPTVLVLYWLENLAVALLTTLRIVLHRHWTRKRGHWREQTDIKFGSNDAGNFRRLALTVAMTAPASSAFKSGQRSFPLQSTLSSDSAPFCPEP